MPSLFDGTDKLICDAMGIQHRNHLNRKTLRNKPLSDDKAFSLVNGLFRRMMANFQGRPASQSKKLWCCRRETNIAHGNVSQETLLEKAVAMLAHQCHMPGWFNQCPVASGIVDPGRDKKRAVDLVHLSDGEARLIELKWASDTPVHALFQILEYGLAYILARLHVRELQLEKRRLMHVKKIGLEVIGPYEFFMDEKQAYLFALMDKAIAKFAAEKTGGALSMSLCAFSFPAEFTCIPFADGREVKETCGNEVLSKEGGMVRYAFSKLEPVR